METKQYLGDNLYAEYTDNHEIRLTVEGSYPRAVIILLTPKTLMALGEFAMREAKAHAN